VPTADGVTVQFDEVWQRRREVVLDGNTIIHVPSIDDLILTKRFASRPKDLEDIRMLTLLRDDEGTR
jgi:hypothetical protein